MSFRRSALRWLLGALLALLALVAVGAGALVLWLRSGPGQRWVGRVIAERVEQRIDGRLSFDRVDGPHLDGIRLEGVVLRDRAGRVVGTVRSVTGHWTPAGLLARRLDRLVANTPVLTVEHLVVRQVQPEVAREHPPQPGRPFIVREIAVRDGALDLYGITLSSIAGTARLELGEQSRLRIAGVDARYGSHPLHSSGDVDWAGDRPVEVRARATADQGALVGRALIRQAPDRWLIEDAVLRTATSRVAGHGWWSSGRIGVVVDEGVLQPRLLDRIVPPLATGEAVRFRGQAQGPYSRLAVTLRTTRTAPLPVVVRGRIDVPRRAGVLAISAGASELHAGGRITSSALDLRLRARVALADAHRLGIPAEAPVEVQARARGTSPWAPTIEARVLAPGALTARMTAAVDIAARRARTSLRIDELHHGTSTLRGIIVDTKIKIHDDVIAFDDLHLHWDGMPRGYRDAAGDARITRASRALATRLRVPTPLGPVSLDGTLLIGSTATELRDLHASLGDSHLRGAVRVVDGRINAAIEELVIQPAMIRRVQPHLEPRWAFRVDGAASGTTAAVELSVRVRAGPSTALLTGTVEPSRHHLRLVGEVDAFDPDVVRPTETEARLHLAFFADLRQASEGLSGVVQVRGAHGNAGEASFQRGLLEASFRGRDFEVTRARLSSPALVITGSGRGTVDGSLHLRYGVLVTNALRMREVPRVVRGFLGLQQILPGRVLEGTIDKRSGQPLEYSYQYLPPGFQQARWLVRLLSGAGRDT